MSIGFRNSNAECTLIPFKLTFAESEPNIKHRLLHKYMNANWITIKRSFCAMCVFKIVMIINTAIPVKYESIAAIRKILAL